MPSRARPTGALTLSLALLVSGCGPDPAPLPGDPAAACAATGGHVVTRSCCAAVPDYPGTCAVGACGCSPENSAPRLVCDCSGSGRCWDGARCVP